MAYKVLQIISSDTIQVTPEWRIWKLGKGGNLVKANGCQLPEGSSNANHSNAKVNLFNLLAGKTVEIKNVYKIKGKTVTADVYLNGKHLSEYFLELKNTHAISETEPASTGN